MTELPITVEITGVISCIVAISLASFVAWRKCKPQAPEIECHNFSLSVTKINTELEFRLHGAFLESANGLPLRTQIEKSLSALEAVSVSNGAVFLRPSDRKVYSLLVPAYLEDLYANKGNSISSDALGIICTLQALESLRIQFPDDLQLFQATKQLVEYVQVHPEKNLITVSRYTFNKNSIHANF